MSRICFSCGLSNLCLKSFKRARQLIIRLRLTDARVQEAHPTELVFTDHEAHPRERIALVDDAVCALWPAISHSPRRDRSLYAARCGTAPLARVSLQAFRS
jgi:hypothetical protein